LTPLSLSSNDQFEVQKRIKENIKPDTLDGRVLIKYICFQEERFSEGDRETGTDTVLFANSEG
jgi:hypothetical protein